MLKFVVYQLLVIVLLTHFGCAPKAVKPTKPAATKSPAISGIFNLKAYVIKEQVNIRQQPSTGSKVIATLRDGDAVQIMENQKGWYRINTENGTQGWVRSDLIGPRNLSKTAMAAAFNDSIMPNFSAQLFIDKNKPYKVIYLKFDKLNPSQIDLYVKRIVNAYQQKVYPGPVTVHVIKDNSDEFIKSYTFKGAAIAEIALPILPYGVLQKFELQDKAVKLYILVGEQKTKNKLLSLAKQASKKYSYPIEKAEIILRAWPSKKCLLYYVEDGYGEDYYFDRCQPPAS